MSSQFPHPLRLSLYFLVVLHPFFLDTPLSSPLSPPPVPPAEIIAINGTASFKSLISHNTITFVKFFHPRCPHCQTFAPHFLALSSLISSNNSHVNTTAPTQVTLAEVDASNKRNFDLINAHARGFPTLKLFSSGRLLSEYTGPRQPQPMFDFLQQTLRIRSAVLVEPLRTRQDLTIFLNQSGSRPVILTIFHPDFHPSSIYPPHIRPSPDAWQSAILVMRNTTRPNVLFASVSNPSHILPTDPINKVRFQSLAPTPYHPVLVAAADASRFWDLAQWWFPDMRHADSMQTFMHLSTLLRDRYIVLDPVLAPIILQTKNPIAIAFGKHSEPSWNQREFLLNAADRDAEPRIVAVYAKLEDYKDFSEHVGVMPEDQEEKHALRGQYVVYRSGVMNPFVDIFEPGGSANVNKWVKQHAQAFEKSRILPKPGQVLDINRDSWSSLFQHDGRGVLLALYRSDCNACKRFEAVFKNAAKMLAPHAGAVVVARFDISREDVPSEPKLPDFETVPTVIYVPGGGDGVLFEGFHWRWALARFARLESETEEIPFASVGVMSLFAWYLGAAGFALLGVGVGLNVTYRLRRRFSKHKTDHLM
eukprot:GFKZ01016021.1.p1 GENE.GFKZ01016021.1~~GFKZ01016021.1.p1  ORF type:complete len:591 (+),score=61.23 GFKZ01016021.1:434-2206(+)